jgi:hypothetical protein
MRDIDKPMIANYMRNFAAFHIAYVAMGLTIWQGGWKHRFDLIFLVLFSSRKKGR